MDAISREKMLNYRLKARLDGVGVVIAALRDEAEWVREVHHEGVITFEEAFEKLHCPDAVRDVMAGVGWSFLPSRASAVECAPPGRFEALMADYDDWLRGPVKDTSDISSWLFDVGPARNYWPGFWLERWCAGVATGEEKGLFFKLAESAFTTIWEFASPPAGTPVPAPNFVGEGGGFTGCLNCYMDAAPLMGADAVLGRWFDLPLADGGTVHMKVTSVEPQPSYSPHAEGVDATRLEWEASGWVEGYTRPVERPIGFTSSYADVSFISVGLPHGDGGEGDVEAFLGHPLWNPYREWADENRMLARTNAAAAVDRFLHVDPSLWYGGEGGGIR